MRADLHEQYRPRGGLASWLTEPCNTGRRATNQRAAPAPTCGDTDREASSVPLAAGDPSPPHSTIGPCGVILAE